MFIKFYNRIFQSLKLIVAHSLQTLNSRAVFIFIFLLSVNFSRDFSVRACRIENSEPSLNKEFLIVNNKKKY